MAGDKERLKAQGFRQEWAERCAGEYFGHNSKVVPGKICTFTTFTNLKARIRKGETGLVIFAGDVTPIEVCHKQKERDLKLFNIVQFEILCHV